MIMIYYNQPTSLDTNEPGHAHAHTQRWAGGGGRGGLLPLLLLARHAAAAAAADATHKEDKTHTKQTSKRLCSEAMFGAS